MDDQRKRLPRSVRNNNPGNLEASPFTQKMPGYVGSDGRFAIFDTPESGFNAMGNLLQSYGNRGFNTVSSILNRYSPQSDPTNKPGSTSNYVNVVAKAVGVDPNAPLDFSNQSVMDKLIRSMTKVEAGGDYFSGVKQGTSQQTAAQAPASQASGPWGQFAQDVIGGATLGAYGTKYPGQGTSSTAIPSLLGQATGGLLGQNTVPSAMGIDTRKFGEVTEPGFSGAALPYQQEVAAAATDMGFKDYAPSMGGAAGIGSALASLGGALAKAGAAKEDMSWVQKELPAHRGKWDDEIFKRSIFGIRGLLG